jgi:acyl-CoA synthetase (AMP-forming)/AMP-acid ligase II
VHTEATLMETNLNSTLLYEVDKKSVFLCKAPMFHAEGYLYIFTKAADGVPNPQLVLDYLQSKIAKYKIPQQMFLLPSLPRTSSGKVLKHVLRDRSLSDKPLVHYVTIQK